MNFDTLTIGLVGPLPPPAGGMANQTRQLAELLASEGAKVELVQVNRPYAPPWVERVRGLRAVARLLPYLLRLWRMSGRVDLVHVMANSGWSWHLFAVPAIWISWFRGTPVIVNYRGGEAGPFLARASRWVALTIRRTSALVLPSGFLEQVFGSYGMTGRVVPNIIDLVRFGNEAGVLRVIEPERGHIVVARNLEALYGIDSAIRAFARLRKRRPCVRLSIAGSGPEEAALKALAVAEGVQDAITFTGRLDRDQMAALYRDADLMLNSSRVDNMPNSVLEALASGVPVVSTDVGGIPFMVEHERTALLVKADAVDDMAEAMAKVLEDQILAQRLRSEGLELVRRYAWPAVKQAWLAVYRDAVGQGRRKTPAAIQ